MGKRSGFTLIELLVVLAAIGLLLSIAAPSYVTHIDHAREVALRENLAAVRDGIDKFHADHARYPADLQELVQTAYLRSLPEDPLTERSDTWVLTVAPEGGLRDIKSGSVARARDGTSYASW
jgi:general secretion pathway protein G